MDEGRILEEGTPEHFFNNPEQYSPIPSEELPTTRKIDNILRLPFLSPYAV